MNTTDTVTRMASVNRDLTPRQVLEATGRKLHEVVIKDPVTGMAQRTIVFDINDVLLTMPSNGRGLQAKVRVVFFKPETCVADDDALALEFRARRLKPDPYAVAAVNQADPGFAEKYPNATYWLNEDGKRGKIMFDQSEGNREVSVDDTSGGWGPHWWFGGVEEEPS